MTPLSRSAFAAAAVGAFIVFVVKLMANRRRVRKLLAAGAPMPKYHPVFGHLPALKESIQALPRNATMHDVVRHMANQFPNGVFYLNLWPFNETVMVVADPSVALQVEAASLNKPAGMCANMDIINGGASLQTMHGSTWKKWRGLLNPGFAAGYIIGLAPVIADEVAVFCRLLQQRAKQGSMFQLEEYTLRLTFDVIGRVTFDDRLHYQTEGSALADCLRRQVYWSPFGTTFNPFRRYLSPRPLVRMYNNYRMNRYLSEVINKRFEELALSRRVSSKGKEPGTRSIISLAMDKYLEELGDRGEISREAFKKIAMPQLRMFLYAGHDTTSSTLLYCFLLLSRHPAVMANVRAEHDEVFGHDLSTEQICRVIAGDPSLLNQLPYTFAVTKEVLRMFPPAGSLRQGRPDLVLSDAAGHRYPTDRCQIWTVPLIMQHRPDVFVKPDEFIPIRWLVGPEDWLYPKKGSWRAFEGGPRACIGQTLAQLELKVALVMTARMFDITPAYEEWDGLHPREGIKSIDGNRVYQAEMGGGGAHPADGFPVRVTTRT